MIVRDQTTSFYVYFFKYFRHAARDPGRRIGSHSDSQFSVLVTAEELYLDSDSFVVPHWVVRIN